MFEEKNTIARQCEIKISIENDFFERFMKNIRYIFRGILIFLGLLVVGRVVYRFVLKNENILTKNHDESLYPSEKAVENSLQQPLEISYDFKKLVKLIDKSSKIKWSAFPGFDELQKQQGLDRAAVTGLLEELLQERVKLRNYILDLKGYSTTGVPVRRYRSLLYYLEVLENNITDMRNLVKKEELFL